MGGVLDDLKSSLVTVRRFIIVSVLILLLVVSFGIGVYYAFKHYHGSETEDNDTIWSSGTSSGVTYDDSKINDLLDEMDRIINRHTVLMGDDNRERRAVEGRRDP